MFGVELARLYASVTSVMPRTAARVETRRKPVRRESSVPAPTTTLERREGPGARSGLGGHGATGAAVAGFPPPRRPPPPPVEEPPHREEQRGAEGEEEAHAAHHRRADRVARALEIEPSVGRAEGHQHGERAGRACGDVELQCLVAPARRDDRGLRRAVRELELLALEPDLHLERLVAAVLDAHRHGGAPGGEPERAALRRLDAAHDRAHLVLDRVEALLAGAATGPARPARRCDHQLVAELLHEGVRGPGHRRERVDAGLRGGVLTRREGRGRR